MKIQKLLWSGLSASAVLLVAGSALPGGTAATTHNQLTNFDQSSGELWAYPLDAAGKPLPIATYLHDANTLHGLADLTKFTPPDPCRGLTEAWNATVRYETQHEGQNARPTQFVFEVLLTLMSDFQCRATVTSTTTGTPQPIVVITPTSK